MAAATEVARRPDGYDRCQPCGWFASITAAAAAATAAAAAAAATAAAATAATATAATATAATEAAATTAAAPRQHVAAVDVCASRRRAATR